MNLLGLKEGDKISNNELHNAWQQILKTFEDSLEYGHDVQASLRLIHHILKNNYSYNLYAGSSLFTLLISLPDKGQINFTRTLQLRPPEGNGYVKFVYWNVPRDQRVSKNPNWIKECKPDKVIEVFEEFIDKDEDWSASNL